MNFITQYAYEQVRAQAKDREWRTTSNYFLDESKNNPLVSFPTGAECEIPDAQRLNMAKLQWQMRRELQNATTFSDGTNFTDYSHAMQRKPQWKLDDDLPRTRRLRLQPDEALRTIDASVKEWGLPQKTRDWYHAHYVWLVKHAQESIEQSRFLEGKTDWLYGEMTGAEPTGRITTLFGPQMIYFRCEKKQDCARLIYPHPKTPSLEERRGEIEAARGAHIVKTLPMSLGGKAISVGAENVEVTKGHDAFSTHDHEQEHAANAFMIHESTALGRAPDDESGIEYCARLGMAGMVKEEFIAWSRRPTTDYAGLFLGVGAPYRPVAARQRQFREAGVEKERTDAFAHCASGYLGEITANASVAIGRLMDGYPHAIVRELLRATPVHEWDRVANVLGQDPRRKNR